MDKDIDIKIKIKLNNTLTCPFCNSTNITSEMLRTIVTETYKKDEYYQKTNKIIFKCMCNKCFKEYTVDDGYERLTRYFHEEPNQNHEHIYKLLSYEVQSNMFRSFDLYDINNHYVILEENDNRPINIDKDLSDDILMDPEVGKKLVYNTWLNRYR